MLEVLVKDNPQAWEYTIPFISSFGYLLLFGWSALTWMPSLIERNILPRFPENMRDFVSFGLMLILVLAYLPALHYSRASYLTGSFLAGLTFSQIHSTHATWVNGTTTLMNWLLRIFFAATIGFQVPVRYFGDPWVIKWGFIFCKYPYREICD
jgi:Kef-type K+ transport system membrane component KefB